MIAEFSDTYQAANGLLITYMTFMAVCLGTIIGKMLSCFPDNVEKQLRLVGSLVLTALSSFFILIAIGVGSSSTY